MSQGRSWTLSLFALLTFWWLAFPQPLAPVREWESPWDKAQDVAWSVDISPAAIAVAGTGGVAIYDQGGRLRAFIPTPGPRRAVLLAEGRLYLGGEGEIAAYTLAGEELWSLPIDGVCNKLAAADGSLLALVGGRALRLSSSGAWLPSPTVERELSSLAARGSLVVLAKGERVWAMGPAGELWTRRLPHPVVDLAVDERGDVWAAGEGELSLLSGRTGAVLWTRRLPARLTAVACPKPIGKPALPIEWAVVAGYAPSPAGDLDYWLAGIDREGEVIWRATYDSDHGDDLAYDVAATVSGTIVATGSASCIVSDASGQDYLTVKYSLQPPGVGGIVGLASSPPVADFEFTPASPLTYDQVTFTNLSHDPDGMIVAYLWELGDATRSYSENVRHCYLHPGEYVVTLTVVDDDGQVASCTKVVPVGNRPPEARWEATLEGAGGELIADFTWTAVPEQHGSFPPGFVPEGITDLDDVAFQDLSTFLGEAGGVRFSDLSEDWDGEIVAWHWEFGDGTSSDEPEPVHHYPGPGVYHVVLTVTDDAGAAGTYEEDVEVGALAGEIVSWEWDFGDGEDSSEQSPRHWFRDDGVYEVTLTVTDEFGNRASVTKEVAIQNVPPVADFEWTFEVPADFLPSCDELLGEGGVAAAGSLAGKAASFTVGEGWGLACQEPEIPADAGVVAFSDLSVDSEPWLEVAEWAWQWDLTHGYWECWEAAGCELDPDPLTLFLWDTERGESFLYRGDVAVTLRVWDEDGEGGEDHPFSHLNRTVAIGNIPPYAAFEWGADPWGSWTELACDGCEAAYGSGDPVKQVSNEQITVTRTIYSWDCGDGEPSAIFAPWGGGGVELLIEGSGTVEVTETFPPGWSYWLGWFDECVAIMEEGEGYFSLSVDLDACGGFVSIWYDLYPPDPWAGTPAEPGLYTISGVFTVPEITELTLDSTVIVCANVNVESSVYFHAYGWDELWMADPNGDEIASWEWDFGEFGTAFGQDPEGGPCSGGMCTFTLDNMACQYDPELGAWVWSYDLPVSLTVTDEAGGGTAVDTIVPLTGMASGWGPE